MGSIPLPYLEGNPRIIFFTDFDGTITLQDSNDFMTDNLGYGQDRRRELGIAVLEHRMSFRDAFRDMLDSVKTPFNECIEKLQQAVRLDPYFVEFSEWCKLRNIPIVVLSSGMVPIITALIEKLLGHRPEHVHIVANDVESRDGKDICSEGGWQVKFHDDSEFGHDKSLEIKPYAALPIDERPTLLYAGDGVSDLSAAAETDLLFAKKDSDLAYYCKEHGLPFTAFEDWMSILDVTKAIYSGKMNVKNVALGQRQAVHKEQEPEQAVSGA